MIERRFLQHELRVMTDAASGNAPKIVGYAAVFNSPTDPDLPWTESIDPHAFDSVLAANPDVRCLWNHNDDHVLGRTKSGTLRLGVDDRGLRYEVDPPDTQVARDLMTSMQRGDVDQSSFGFSVGDDDWSEDANGKPVRRIKSIRSLLDVSPITYPAYPASSSGVRSMPDSMPAEYRSRLEARRVTHTKKVDGENLTADCFLIVGDPEKTETWNLPWKFSDEEKTKSHLRDALARFNQLKDVPEDKLSAAWTKLVKLCKEHGIDVSDETQPKPESRSLNPGQCVCVCPQCRAGSCGICSADPQCEGAERNSYADWYAKAEFELSL